MAAPPAANPEQLRRKWDALLKVVNSAGGTDRTGAPAAPSAGEAALEQAAAPAAAARELVQEGGAAPARQSRSTPSRRRPQWDPRHVQSYSTQNHIMHKNLRSYFDRHREADPMERPALRCSWQLEIPEDPAEEARLKELRASGKLPRASSLPRPVRLPDADFSWDTRFQVVFTKDNHHYHPSFRHYFERPRSLLW